MKTLAQLCTLALMFAIALPQAAYARGKGRGLHKIIKELDLSKEQKEKMGELKKGHREKVKAMRASMKANQEKFNQTVSSGTASESELRTLFEKSQKMRNDLQKLNFEQSLKIRSILTDDQKKRFSKAWGEQMKRHRPGHEGDDRE